jgi:S-formylglutathione hydrolase FrmB
MNLFRRLGAAVLAMWLLLPSPAARAGEVLTAQFEAPSLGRAWKYDVYLPTGYAHSHQHYKVVYLLHGWGTDASSWITQTDVQAMADHLIASGQMLPCILVMPQGRGSWYVDGPEKMETAFIDDLLPEIDHTYRTLPGREGRGIAGFSMGGYGTMRLALRHPDQFSAMAMMSPAIYAPLPPLTSAARVAPAFETGGSFDAARWQQMNYPALLDDFARSGYPMRVQLTAGLQDALDTETAASAFATLWRAHHWPCDLRLSPGGHDYAFWRRALPMALRFLAPPPLVAELSLPNDPGAARTTMR